MENHLIVFENDNFGRVRTMTQSGEPWFVAKEVCDMLALRTDNIKMVLDDDEYSNTYTIGVKIPGANRGMNIISEAGLYSLIMKSRKLRAKIFKRFLPLTTRFNPLWSTFSPKSLSIMRYR